MNSGKTQIFGFIFAVLLGFFYYKPLKVSKKKESHSHSVAAGQVDRLPASLNKNAAVAAAAVSEKELLLKSIQETKECFQSQTCDFPKTDPREYDFAVGQKLQKQLKEFHRLFVKDPRAQEDLLKLSQEFITSEDNYVQEEALSIAGDLPVSSDNARALSEVLPASTDPSIVEQAMKEMTRYLGTTEEPAVQQAVQGLLASGPVLSSQKAVQQVQPFINATSYASYSQVQKTLPKDSRVSKDLKSALDEFQRQQSGG